MSFEYQPEVDDMVEISEPKSAFHGKVGTIVTVLASTVRVMFPHIEGYSIFTFGEIKKIGEQPYKEK